MHSSNECRKKSETKEKGEKKKSEKSEKKSKQVENLTLKVLQTIAEHVDQGGGSESESCCSP